MTKITTKKEVIFKGTDGKFYIIELNLEDGLDYNEEDINYIKEIFNSGISDKGGICKDGSYIYWKVKKK